MPRSDAAVCYTAARRITLSLRHYAALRRRILVIGTMSASSGIHASRDPSGP